MVVILFAVLVVMTAIDIFLSASVIHHLRQYSLPGWTLAKIVMPLYLALSGAALVSAIWWLAVIRSIQ